MLDPSLFDFCSEYYVVVKVIEVIAKMEGVEKHFRIEALHGPESVIPYSTRCYTNIRVAISTPLGSGNELDLRPDIVSMWAHYDLPPAAGDSADAAIERALGFLRERSLV